MKQTNQVNEKLPLEYPFRTALQIYAKRLGIFLLVVALNLGLFGLLISELTKNIFLITSGLIVYIIFIIYYYESRPPSFIFTQAIIKDKFPKREKPPISEKQKKAIILLLQIWALLSAILLGYSLVNLLIRFF